MARLYHFHGDAMRDGRGHAVEASPLSPPAELIELPRRIELLLILHNVSDSLRAARVTLAPW